MLLQDHGDGKDLDLACMGVPREKLERERVRYLTTEELAHYEVRSIRLSALEVMNALSEAAQRQQCATPRKCTGRFCRCGLHQGCQAGS